MASTASQSRLYRALWRWHFYAGLIVAPFLLILAVTGAIYLFNDEINDALSPELRFVAPVSAPMPTSHLIRAALAAHPGAASRIDLPSAPDRPAVVFVTPAHGDKVRVAVDPGTGGIIGSYVYERTLVGFADEMHGSLTIGTMGDRIVELAACWALFLIASGLFLWWPRGRRSLAGILYPRVGAKGRLFWRDLHAVTGVWTVALIAFLLFTGLPWAGVQGDVLKHVTGALGIGYPASTRNYGAPRSEPVKTAPGGVPWTLEGAPMPKSDAAHAGHPGHGIMAAGPDDAAVSGIDRIVRAVALRGVSGGYRLFLPAGAEGVYTAYTYPDRPQGQRTLYYDRYSGGLIREIRYADYGWAAKAIELGVQLHMGNYFGRANQIVMLIPCIGIILLVVSGTIMWWKRRPEGRLGAPPQVAGARVGGALALLVIAGVLMPLLGASLVVLFAVDRLFCALPRRPHQAVR